MNIRRFPAAAFATGTLTMWLHSTALVAQETPAPNTAPDSAAAPVAEPVQLSSGAADILKLSRAKVNDDVTAAFIQNGDRRYSLTASEIVYLRKAGVSDRVLTAMLNQQPQSAPAPQPAAPETAPTASAPQYAAPVTTTVAEGAPASTLYVIPSTPSYYSFYDPWPYYWYEPWPYWYTSSYSCGYPFFTFGFYWGNCSYGYWNHGYGYHSYWNNCWHDGNHQAPPNHWNHSAPNGNSPPRGPGGKTGMQASKASPSGGVNQAGLRSGPGPSAHPAQGTAQPGLASDNRSLPAAPRAGATEAKVASSRSGQSASPTSIGSAPNDRTAARDSIGNKGVTPFTRNSQPVPPRARATPTGDVSTRSAQVAGPTKVWTGSAGQAPTTRSVVSKGTPSVAGPSRASASPTTVWNRSASQPPSRAAVSPAATYQRSSVSPSYASRGSGNVASIGRSSMSSSYAGMGSPAFRGGGGFSGASAPRMPSGGGGYRGGGGGGGGFSHGGGGGGGHHR